MSLLREALPPNVALGCHVSMLFPSMHGASFSGEGSPESDC